MAEQPILRRFPALGMLPRVDLGNFPTPVERVTLRNGQLLLVKRDDLTAAHVGGNKVRALEWLLAGIRAGDRVLTVGPRGSTHALITATFARRLGAHVTVVRWNQPMNSAARCVSGRLEAEASIVDARVVAGTYAIAGVLRLRRRTRWIPAGAATPVAVLGHVNAALELVEQSKRGEFELPTRVVVPLGTGGTAAGLALGFRLSGVPVQVVAVRVVSNILGRRGRVLSFANRAAQLIERVTRERLPRVNADDVIIANGFYGAGYGRPLDALADERALETLGVRLDDTYSRKAFAAASALGNHATLFWLTFDGRLLETGAKRLETGD